MKLSVKTDYAARAVLGLAQHYPAGLALPAETLAAAQGAPGKFLIQILVELKAQGIVRSVRGMAGGYLLARPPADITLADVLEAVDGPLFDAPALSAKDCPAELRRAWKKLRQSLESAARATTFQQLLEESAEKEKMYYI
ncbi:MAG: Rrf2 family transcriptional regulator [Verrucomicrobiota bacterium]